MGDASGDAIDGSGRRCSFVGESPVVAGARVGRANPTDVGGQRAWGCWLRKRVEQLIFFSIAEGVKGWGVILFKTAVKQGELVGGWGLGRGGVEVVWMGMER